MALELVIVCSTPNGRGIHQYAIGISRRLKRASVVTPCTNRWYLWWELVGILTNLRDIIRADAVVFANTRITPLLEPFLANMRVGVVVHDLMDTLYEHGYRKDFERPLPRVKRWINTCIMKRSIRRASLIIVNSNATRIELKESRLANNRLIYVINPGPSFIVGRNDLMKREEQSKHGVSQGVEILSIAGSTPNKSASEYISLISILVSELHVDASLVLVGLSENDIPRKVIDVYRKYKDRIELRKRVTDEMLVQLYLDTDVYISLSSNEGFGIPLADAAGFSIPVIARDIPSFREIAELGLGKEEFRLCKDVRDCAKIVQDCSSRYIAETKRGSICREKRIASYLEYCKGYEFTVNQRMEMLMETWGKA